MIYFFLFESFAIQLRLAETFGPPSSASSMVTLFMGTSMPSTAPPHVLKEVTTTPTVTGLHCFQRWH